MTPPPITTRCFGTSASSSAPVEVDDPLLVELDAGQRRDRRAGGDDDVLRGDGAVADLDRVRALEAAAALQPLDLVLLEQELDAAGQALHRVLALAVHRVEVELGA